MTEFHFESLLLPEGWASRVSVSVDRAGFIAAVAPDSDPAPGAIRLGTGLPGMANLHSHSFQRAMAGLTERRGPGEDSFWSWRQLMYGFNAHLDPDHVEVIAAMVQLEMLESGFTAIGEFHYLHHDADGSPYDDRAEMAARICAAAQRTGIALTMLPVFYRWAGFGNTPAGEGQRRFLNDPDSYAALIEATQRHLAALPHAALGIAPHSLRAASMEDIAAILPLAEGGPVHIHIAEQMKEVEDCRNATGTTPLRYLLDTQPVGENWCLVHATHMDESETADLARSGAVAGLCPLTEANLGDGLFPATRYLAQQGRIGIGSDSHIRIDLPEEIRLLEYGARLTARQRNVLAPNGISTGRFLYGAALTGGAQALGQPMGSIAAGRRADFVELATGHPLFAGRTGDALLDSWLFSGDSRQVRTVHVGGRRVVENGRALARDMVETAWPRVMADILERLAA